MNTNRPEMDTPEYKAFRFAVFARDGFTCQLHGGKDKPLQAHHVIPWATNENLRYLVSNGITLCEDCHKLVTGRERDFQEQFQKIIALKKIQKTGKVPTKIKGRGKYVFQNPRVRY